MSETLKSARRLHGLGFAIIWLHPKSKRPIGDGWTTGPRKKWDELNKTFVETNNVGVRLGTPSKMPNGFLAAIDCDVKSEDKRHYIEMRESLKKIIGGKKLPQVSTGRGNGSAHLYCRTSETFKTFTPYRSKEIVEVRAPSKSPSKKEHAHFSKKQIANGWRLAPAWEISIYSDGRQCVLPPSIHPDSGREYKWNQGVHSIEDLPTLEFEIPQDEERGIAVQESKSAPKDNEKFTFQVQNVDLGWLPISDEVKDGIVSGDGVDDRSEFLLRATSALHAAGLGQAEILSVLTDTRNYISSCAYDHAQTKNRSRAANWLWKYTVRKVLHERAGNGAWDGDPKKSGKNRKLTPEEQAKQTAEIAADISWRDDLDKTKQGQLQSSLKNLDLIFTNSVQGNIFVKDLFANRLVYGIDSPWARRKDQALEDIDLILVKRWLAEHFGVEPSTNLILEATALVGHREAFHPVQDWLRSLKWDGKPRLNTWLKDYCQAKAEEPYLSQVSRKFLMAMVKRVFEPGCQWDYVLVLEGKQGKFKSSIARAIASDRWFMDNLPDLKDKDAMLNLQGKWLIELGELADVKRSDYNLVKAYLVRRVDSVRAHYGRLKEDVPRQSVFIGTINEGQYLKDPTGNRRYWPVKVGTCDVKGLTAVRDQIFAEAYALYKKKTEGLYLDANANDQATEAQEDRRVEDDSTEMRDLLIQFMKADTGFNFRKFHARELFSGVSAPWGQWEPKGWVLNMAATVLTQMGFIKIRVRGGRFWRQPTGTYMNGGLSLEGVNKGCRLSKRAVTPDDTPVTPDFY